MQRNSGRGRGKGNIKNRLGFQTARVKNTQFGKPERTFDIREKLSVQRKQQIQDARDEISKKTKFVDARIRIQNKQATKKPLDARDRIKPKPQKQGQAQGQVITPSFHSNLPPDYNEPKVMVTGLGRVHHFGGNIIADCPPPGAHEVFANSNNIIITAQNNPHQMYQSFSEIESQPPLPKVKIQNDFYQKTKQKVVSPRITSPVIQSKHVAPRIKPPPVLSTQPKPTQTIRANPVPRPKPAAPVIQKVSVPIRPTMTRPIVRQAAPEDLETVPLSDYSEDPTEAADIVSPLQGYRVMVTNLHPSVTQEDMVELFSDIGALKRARILKKGIAEVVFVRKPDAVVAVKRYHNRELDGMPMLLKLTGVAAAKSPKAAAVPLPPQPVQPEQPATGSTKKSDVDIAVIHKALFKTAASSDAPTKPVTFTIKI